MFSGQLVLCQPFSVWGWFVWRLGEWFALVGCGGSNGGGDNFYCICRLLICNFTEHVSFLQVFFMYFAKADYLPDFYVDWYPCRKGLIVTWRQILKCDMTRDSMHMGKRESIHLHVCIYVCTQTCMSVCMWLFTCAFAHMHHYFNCILTIACACAYSCVCVHLCIFIYVWMHACVMFMCICLCICVNVCMYVYIYVCRCTYFYVCVFMSICVCVYMCVCIYVWTVCVCICVYM